MPTKIVDSQLVAVINDFNVSVAHSINYKSHQKESDLDTPVYDSYTCIKLITDVIKPSEQKGYQLKLELSGDEPHAEQFKSKLEDWRNSPIKENAEKYIPPSSIGCIGRSRKKLWKATYKCRRIS